MKILIERLEKEEKRGHLKYYICFESCVDLLFYLVDR